MNQSNELIAGFGCFKNCGKVWIIKEIDDFFLWCDSWRGKFIFYSVNLANHSQEYAEKGGTE